jgi:hypothetical protein
MITAAELRELLIYDQHTGKFTWRVSRGTAKAGAPTGCPNSDGYPRIRISKRLYKAHRLAWLYVYGEWPPQLIDHINCNRDDNRLSNLRLADLTQNQANRPPGKNNTSGFKGVSWRRREKRWTAEITRHGQKIQLGTFLRAEDAAEAYRKAALEHFGEFARA